MRGRRLLDYRDAVAILTGDGSGLVAADRALGGALALATGGVSDAVLTMFDARGRILRLGRDLTTGLGDRLAGADRATRTQRLAAAHTVLVITAYFEVLGEVELPFRLADLELTRDEQLTVVGDGGSGDLLDRLPMASLPRPAPHRPYESVLRDLEIWYDRCSNRLLMFLSGLAVWERLSDGQRQATHGALFDGPFLGRALDRYEELYARLAQDVPEFGFWSGQTEHQATRTALRRALTGIETALAGLTADRPLDSVADALATGYRAALERAILAEGQAPAGVALPTLGKGYVDPGFRVRQVADDPVGPAEEEWWEDVRVRTDLTEYLAGTLTSLAGTHAPLVVLGQPGAGKSVLTKILAARLSTAGFLPVRIILREVPADTDVQDQIEHAIRAGTGERATWPELVRAAGGAVPVLLFDGFDELLQATGVSQSDFLTRLARFQQREADQGRPVYTLVTSRTAVADRARYPDGSVVLRLEPFDRAQIERWLDLWNGVNEMRLTERGLLPLPTDIVIRHETLASQPLLLLMLALYDGADNALQRHADGEAPLGEAQLYEELLTSFARREVRKSTVVCTDRELRDRAEQELQRLSLISFGMLNRSRQWLTSTEAESDLSALLGRPAPVQGAESGFRAPLGQGQIALGRFFFVQRAQAIRDEQRLATYEFLHATFGEYLAARLTVHLAEGLLAQRPALSVGRTTIDDDLLYVLLSYAPLSSRQILRFAHARIQAIPPESRRRLGDLLIAVLAEHGHRTEHRYAGYRPALRTTSARHGLYSANILILTVLVTGEVRASELFAGEEDPAAAWNRQVLQWRSAFWEPDWMDFVAVLEVIRTWDGDRRDLAIRWHMVSMVSAEPVDPYWLFGRSPEHEDRRRRVSWSRSYGDLVAHRLAMSGDPNDAVVLHGLAPFFMWLPPAVTRFVGTPGGVTSVAHGLLSLWLASGLAAPDGELSVQYEHCAAYIAPGSGLDQESLSSVAQLVFGQLVRDVGKLPARVVCQVLSTPASESLEPVCWELRARAALAALGPHGSDGGVRACARDALVLLANTAPVRLLALCAHRPVSPVATRTLRSAIASVLETLPAGGQLASVPPELMQRARAFAAQDP
ncbi:NACHT domain-containing protein [Streptomyces yaizuensis]|uniref:ATP-binding protein n=1 Tax=Streptomyces yaizuensis TaxID=2989713 RepID=A0ABQ5P6Z6_9ACTN|nr:hypothetical protein [Streptomyces sp. YSPA8]GLF98371.1 ATP-binding protein [Streptomyces sp. YSPA8]